MEIFQIVPLRSHHFLDRHRTLRPLRPTLRADLGLGAQPGQVWRRLGAADIPVEAVALATAHLLLVLMALTLLDVRRILRHRRNKVRKGPLGGPVARPGVPARQGYSAGGSHVQVGERRIRAKVVIARRGGLRGERVKVLVHVVVQEFGQVAAKVLVQRVDLLGRRQCAAVWSRDARDEVRGVRRHVSLTVCRGMAGRLKEIAIVPGHLLSIRLLLLLII